MNQVVAARTPSGTAPMGIIGTQQPKVFARGVPSSLFDAGNPANMPVPAQQPVPDYAGGDVNDELGGIGRLRNEFLRYDREPFSSLYE